MITFNSEIDSQNRKRALGILLFWFEKYAQDGEDAEDDEGFDLFEKAYRHLLEKKAPFPEKPMINPNQPSSKKEQSA